MMSKLKVRSCPSNNQKGSVTAEVAIVFPVIALLLFFSLELGKMMQIHLTVQDAAHHLARLAARGESEHSLHTTLQRLAPSATWKTKSNNHLITIYVLQNYRLSFIGASFDITSHAQILDEKKFAQH